MEVQDYYDAILRGENPNRTNMSDEIMLEFLSDDFKDILIVYKYIINQDESAYAFKVICLFIELLKNRNINEFCNINTLAECINNETINIHEINNSNYNIILYMAINFNVTFVLCVSDPQICVHSNIIYCVRNIHPMYYVDRYLYNILPRELLYITQESVNFIIEQNIVLSEYELRHSMLHVESSTEITDEFIEKIPECDKKIHIHDKVINNLLSNNKITLLRKLIRKCKVIDMSIDLFIQYKDILLDEIPIIWYSVYLPVIRYDNRIYFNVEFSLQNEMENYQNIFNSGYIKYVYGVDMSDELARNLSQQYPSIMFVSPIEEIEL